MAIIRDTSAFPVGQQLVALLASELNKAGDIPARSVVLNFRDPKYSAEKGGYHPVEIAIGDRGEILYITEFSYFGIGPYAELGKSADFDFSQQCYQNEYRCSSIHERGVETFYRVWEQNFCAYCAMGVFKVQVSALGGL